MLELKCIPQVELDLRPPLVLLLGRDIHRANALLVLLLASKKLVGVAIIGGLAAFWAGIKSLFRRKPQV